MEKQVDGQRIWYRSLLYQPILGGAAKYVEMATKKGKTIINLAEQQNSTMLF